MGKLTFTAKLSPTETYKGDVQVSDANVTRIIDVYRGVHYPLGVLVTPAVYINNDPGPPILSVPAVYRPATNQEVVLAIANGIANGLKANALSVEKNSAKIAAEQKVPDIAVDPAIP